MSPGLLNPFGNFGAGSGSYDTEVLADSPVDYFKFAEASGTTMVDSSGNGNDGSYTGSPTFAGVDGVLFAGGSQFATFPITGLPSGDSPYTLEAIVKPSGVSGAHDIVGLAQGAASTNQANSMGLTGTNAWNYWNGSNVTTSGVTISTAAWWHIMAVYNQSTLVVYVQSVSRGSAARSAHNTVLGTTASIAQATNGTQRFAGNIRRVAVYASALSPARVSAHFNAAPLT